VVVRVVRPGVVITRCRYQIITTACVSYCNCITSAYYNYLLAIRFHQGVVLCSVRFVQFL
jgi:hypothetical protein